MAFLYLSVLVLPSQKQFSLTSLVLMPYRTNHFKNYKPKFILLGMAIFNHNNCKSQPRQLYRIKYSDPTIQEDRELYVLAFDYRSALDMFAPYYNTMKHNPRDIPDSVTEEDGQRAMDSILGIERMADVVLAIK